MLLLTERLELQLIEGINETKAVGTEPQDLHKEVTNDPKEITDQHKAVTNDLEVLTENLPTLPDQVKESNRTNVLFTEVREYLANLSDQDRPNVYLRGSRAENGLLYKENKLWVAKDLRLDVIKEVHDQPAVGHADVKRIVLLI